MRTQRKVRIHIEKIPNCGAIGTARPLRTRMIRPQSITGCTRAILSARKLPCRSRCGEGDGWQVAAEGPMAKRVAGRMRQVTKSMMALPAGRSRTLQWEGHGPRGGPGNRVTTTLLTVASMARNAMQLSGDSSQVRVRLIG